MGKYTGLLTFVDIGAGHYTLTDGDTTYLLVDKSPRTSGLNSRFRSTVGTTITVQADCPSEDLATTVMVGDKILLVDSVE